MTWRAAAVLVIVASSVSACRRGSDNRAPVVVVQGGSVVGCCTAAAFSPDGRLLATLGGAGVTLWDTTSGLEVRTLTAGWNTVDERLPHETMSTMYSVAVSAEVAFSPDGRYVAARGTHARAEADGRPLKVPPFVWDVASGAAVQSTRWVFDRERLYPVDESGRWSAGDVARWPRSTDGALARWLRDYRGPADSFSPDARWGLSIDAGGAVAVRDERAGASPRPLPASAFTGFVHAFSPDGAALVVSSTSGGVAVVDLSTGASIARPIDTTASASAAVFSASGRWLAIATADDREWLVDPRTWKVVRELPRADRTVVRGLAFDSADRTLATVDDHVHLTDIGAGAQQRQFGGAVAAAIVDIAIDNQRLLVHDATGDGRAWDLGTGDSRRDRARTDTPRFAVGAALTADGPEIESPDGSTIVAGRRSGWLDVTDAHSLDSRDVRAHDGPVRALAFSADGRLLASGGCDGQIALWDAKSWTRVRTLAGHTGCVSAVTFARDGSVVSAGADGSVRLWDVRGRERAAIAAPPGSDDWIVVAPDGRYDGTRRAADTFVAVRRGPTARPIAADRAGVFTPHLLRLYFADASGGIR